MKPIAQQRRVQLGTVKLNLDLCHQYFLRLSEVGPTLYTVQSFYRLQKSAWPHSFLVAFFHFVICCDMVSITFLLCIFFFNCLVVAELFCYCHNESSPAYMTFHIFLAPVKTCKRFPVSSWLQVVISGSMSLICGQGIKPCKSWGNKQQLIYLILYSWEWKLYLFSNSSAIIH